MATRTKSKIWRYWGFGVMALLALAFGDARLGPAFYLVLIGLSFAFVLFQVPTYCGAINREQRNGDILFCRNNSVGILLGCHLRQHRWQKFGHYWWTKSWRVKSRGLWSSGAAKFATVTAIIGTATGIYGCFKK